MVIKSNDKSKVKSALKRAAWTAGIWFLFCFLAPISRGYYHIPESPRTTFQEVGKKTISPGRVDAFVLYEHTGPAFPGSVKAAQLQHRSERFVPADAIPANPPIHMVPRRPIDPANEVTNFLYANLKLKQLIEESINLQMRAQEVLAGLGTPATVSGNRSGTAGQPGSFHQQQEALLQKQLVASRAFPPPAGGASLTEGFKADGAASPPAAGMDNYRVTDSAGVATKGVAELSPGSAAERGFHARNTEASLPWIIEMAFNIIAYFQANKVEAIIYGVLTMVIFMGLSHIRRR